MKIFQIIIIFFSTSNVKSFKNLFKLNNKYGLIDKKQIVDINLKKGFKKDYKIFFQRKNNEINIKEKTFEYLKLIRYHNIIPTFLLCFSGGWIINPSFYNLLHSTSFVISTIDTIILMSASMVINDIYDLEIDKINSPERPLASGKINIYEALNLASLLIIISEYLTLNYASYSLSLIVQLVIIIISIYTPILKRIPILKNTSCAFLVSFSLFFSGVSVANTILSNVHNLGLLSITMNLVFYGSWTNELLLDMRDIEGDKKNNINTFPTYFGNKKSWIFANIIIYYGIITNTLSLFYFYNNVKIALLIPTILSPLLVNLNNIEKENYSNRSIVNYMKYSNYPLIVLLFYICLLAKYY
jgi:geranylgeranylglycerol-phosphate geranylgeranyltransferase